jgi:hypothetical protein
LKTNPHYTNFITKVRYLYEAIGDTFDVSISYPWVLYLFTGLDEQQVRKMTQETADWQLTQPIEKVKWTSPASIPRQGWGGFRELEKRPRDSNLKCRIFSALSALRDLDIWICTASLGTSSRKFPPTPVRLLQP